MAQGFDKNVIRALEKWPDVPACYGWLSLDRRGNWLIKEQAITHSGAIAFLSRNYACDKRGQWFVQNGPQRAYCALAYTPWIYHFDGSDRIFTHTENQALEMRSIVVDDTGDVLFETEHGIGLLEDRDLAKFIEILELHADTNTPTGAIAALIGGLDSDACDKLELQWYGRSVVARAMRATNVPAAFGFIAAPSELSE